MKLKNSEIKSYAEKAQIFRTSSAKIPIKIGFFIQKNLKIIEAAAQEIEQMRYFIGQKYGEYSEQSNSFVIKPENIKNAQKDLKELYEIEQDLSIIPIALDAFGDLSLSNDEIESILYMIME